MPQLPFQKLTQHAAASTSKMWSCYKYSDVLTNTRCQSLSRPSFSNRKRSLHVSRYHENVQRSYSISASSWNASFAPLFSPASTSEVNFLLTLPFADVLSPWTGAGQAQVPHCRGRGEETTCSVGKTLRGNLRKFIRLGSRYFSRWDFDATRSGAGGEGGWQNFGGLQGWLRGAKRVTVSSLTGS